MKAVYRVLLCCILLLSILSACGNRITKTPEPTPTATSAPQINITDNITLTEGLKELKERNPALSSLLNEFITEYQSGGKEAALEWARERRILDAKDNLPVTLVLDTEDPAVIEELSAKAEGYGCIVAGNLGNELELLIPLSIIENYKSTEAQQTLLDELTTMEHVENVKITTFMKPMGEIEGEGVEVVGADQWHEDGNLGQGIKVGILDFGFGGYEALLGSELPENVTVKSFSVYGDVEDCSGDYEVHGTAVAEIIHELAPEAELYFACQDGSTGSFTRGARWLADQGVDIINHSGGGSYGPFDGSSPEDTLVDEITEQGILWTISAGNEGAAHWRGKFSDAVGDGYHYFDEWDNVVVCGDQVILNWWDNPYEDYDLYLIDANDTTIEYKSIDDQKNGGFDPVEGLMVPNGCYHALIKAEQDAVPVTLDLFVHGELDQDFIVPERSLSSPGSAKTALTVGATYWQDDAIEDYSSRGPSSDGRLKPEISAPARTSGASYGAEGFPGTSAAAPHVAGAAALVLSAYPDMSVEELKDYLQEESKDLGITGEDNVYGYGRLSLPGSETTVEDTTEEDTTGSFNFMIPAIIIAILIMLLALPGIQRQNRAKVGPAPSMPPPPPVPSGPVGGGIKVEAKPTSKTTSALYLRTTQGHSHPLKPGPNLIGRSSACNIKIADEQMSRQHTRVTVTGKQVTVEDLSTNGTFINSHRVIIPSQLKPGDSMRCGQTIFTLEDTTVLGHTHQTPTLTIKSGSQKGAQFPLPQKTFVTIGRGTENDIVVQDARASRKHAQIVKDGNAYYVYDLGSAGGTLVNGTPINQQYRLKNGDEIQIGHTIILFRERP